MYFLLSGLPKVYVSNGTRKDNLFKNQDILSLRTVPTIVTAHTFCTSRDTRVSYGWCLLFQGYFARFKTMRRKQHLASAFGIQKENWG